MCDYEIQRRRHVADAIALAPRLIERLRWSADHLASHRQALLRGLVDCAIEQSPWHRQRLAGLDVGGLDERSLRGLPAMTKFDLMENFDQILTDERLSLELVNRHLQAVSRQGYLLDGYTAITSGGSSGLRGVFVYDWEGWAVFWLSAFRYLLRAKWSDPDLAPRPAVLAWVAAARFTHATAALSRTFASPEFVNYRFPVTLATEEIVAGLNRVQPDMLIAYSSALHVLSLEARAGRLRIAPRIVRSAAEPLLPEIRAAAEQAWGVPVRNGWGTSEGGGTGVGCDHSQMHLSEDLLIVEPVDEHGRPVAPGERSAKVYLTNLYNRALPLIRYEISDEVTILPDPCRCGSAHRCLADIQGRLDDTFVYGEQRVHAHLFRSALAHHPGVVEYQVRQTDQGAQIEVRCGAAVDLQSLIHEITKALAGSGLPSPRVEATVVERIGRDPAPAKLKRFVPLRPAPEQPPREPQSTALVAPAAISRPPKQKPPHLDRVRGP